MLHPVVVMAGEGIALNPVVERAAVDVACTCCIQAAHSILGG